MNIITKVLASIMVAVLLANGVFFMYERHELKTNAVALQQARNDAETNLNRANALQTSINALQASIDANKKAVDAKQDKLDVLKDKKEVTDDKIKTAAKLDPDWANEHVPDGLLKAVNEN